jgi:hypothetical protein
MLNTYCFVRRLPGNSSSRHASPFRSSTRWQATIQWRAPTPVRAPGHRGAPHAPARARGSPHHAHQLHATAARVSQLRGYWPNAGQEGVGLLCLALLLHPLLAVLPAVLAALLLGLRQGPGAPLWQVPHGGGALEALLRTVAMKLTTYRLLGCSVYPHRDQHREQTSHKATIVF